MVSTLGARMSAEERGCEKEGVEKRGVCKEEGYEKEVRGGEGRGWLFCKQACVRVVRYTLPLKSRAAILILLVML